MIRHPQVEQLLLQTERGLSGIRNPRFRKFLRQALEEAAEGDLEKLRAAQNYKRFPVPVEEFLLSDVYMDAKKFLYPAVVDELIEVNSGKYVEALFVGGIGSAKTTSALYTNAYQIYLLSCLKSPHKPFGLDPSSEMLFAFQNRTETLAKTVSYNRFRAMIRHSPYFQKHFMFDKRMESRMLFPYRIEVVPCGASQFGTIGQNVIGGVIDELNFMDVTSNSKRSVDGGTYDQAQTTYNSIATRRKTRFSSQGKLPGILCLVSSRRYPGQFTDHKEMEAKTDPTIYIYDKRVWEIKPDSFKEPKFPVFIGDVSRKPRIVEDPDELEEVDEEDLNLYDFIPETFRQDFQNDIYQSLRDVAGVSTLALTPFITNVAAVNECFGKRPSLLTLDKADMITKRPNADPKAVSNPHLPRFVHGDFSINGDSTGVVMGHVSGFKAVPRGDTVEVLPIIEIDFAFEIVAPKNGEVEFHRIRTMLYNLRDKMGINIKWATFDSFQSRDSIQTLRQQGIRTGLQSMDTKVTPYVVLKQALYDERVRIPENQKLKLELLSLEYDTRKDKIDHPSTGSKDIADSLAGVVFGLTNRREIWTSFDISPSRIPEELKERLKKDNTKE